MMLSLLVFRPLLKREIGGTNSRHAQLLLSPFATTLNIFFSPSVARPKYPHAPYGKKSVKLV